MIIWNEMEKDKRFSSGNNKMKMIFNHLLIRILNLASERLLLITVQRSIIVGWMNNPEDRSKYVRRARGIVDDLLRNQDHVHDVLEALEESKPGSLTSEQDEIVTTIRKSFKWALKEYQAVLEYAQEVKFDPQVLEELHKDQNFK